jgi:5-methylcytosine-specific restriction enzyme A
MSVAAVEESGCAYSQAGAGAFQRDFGKRATPGDMVRLAQRTGARQVEADTQVRTGLLQYEAGGPRGEISPLGLCRGETQLESWKHDKRSRHERGYGAAWVKLRARILQRDCYRCRCEDCRRTGELKPATEVDHIISKAAWVKRTGTEKGVDAESNLQAINHDCHMAKGLRERGYREPQRIGADGYPMGVVEPRGGGVV